MQLDAETRQERLLHLADVVEASDTYDQTAYFHSADDGCRTKNEEPGIHGALCGTPGCVAGHAVSLFDSETAWDPDDRRLIHRTARDLLGLSISQAADLFDGAPLKGRKIGKELAAEVLRRLAYTGNVDWKAIPRGEMK